MKKLNLEQVQYSKRVLRKTHNPLLKLVIKKLLLNDVKK